MGSSEQSQAGGDRKEYHINTTYMTVRVKPKDEQRVVTAIESDQSRQPDKGNGICDDNSVSFALSYSL
jgi:uncharacterized membrane protein